MPPSEAAVRQRIAAINSLLAIAELRCAVERIRPVLVRYLRRLRRNGDCFALQQATGFRLIAEMRSICVQPSAMRVVLHAVFMLPHAELTSEFAAAFNHCGVRAECSYEQTATMLRCCFPRSETAPEASDELFTLFDMGTASTLTPLSLRLSMRDLAMLQLPQVIHFIPKNVIVMKRNSIDCQNFVLERPARCSCGNCGYLDAKYDLAHQGKDGLVKSLQSEKCTCLRSFAAYLIERDWAELLYNDRKQMKTDYFRMTGSIRDKSDKSPGDMKTKRNYPFYALFQCFECPNPVINVEYGSGCKLELRKSKFGFGIFAAHPISKFALVCEYCGDLVSNIRTRERGLQQDSWRESYFYDLGINSKYSLDAFEYGDAGRWLNHSKKPNLQTITVLCQDVSSSYLTQIWFQAIRTISQGEELLIDYGYPKEVAQEYPWSE